MSNFTPSQAYTPKDSLATGDPNKLIKGLDFDTELNAIAVAIATKYDSTSIASQAQAEAGASGTTLLTPLRLTNWADFGAGMVSKLRALTDPNADRIVFWDESAGTGGTLAYLTAGTSLVITGTTIAVDPTTIAISSLSGYNSNALIDHTTVSIVAGTALSGGGTIAATRTLNVDITGLTQLVGVDLAADYALVYDASATTHKKTLLSDLVGAELGDGKWKLSGSQALTASTEATVQFATTVYNSLTRGTYSTGTYTYTATVATRLLVGMRATCLALDAPGQRFEVAIQKNTVDIARDFMYNFNNSSPIDTQCRCETVVSLAAGDTIRFRAKSQTAENLDSTEALTYAWIVELA